MLPQIVIPDSANKTPGKLPFAPFLSPENVTKATEQAKKFESVSNKKKKTEKSAEKKNTEKQQITFPLSIQKPKDTIAQTQPPLLVLSADSAVADTSLALSDSVMFRFSDDEAATDFTNNQSPFSGSQKYFSAHQLQAQSSYPQPYSPTVPDWFTVILVLIICGITAVKIFYTKIFRQLFEAFYSLAVTNQVVRDENILVQRASVLLNVIFYGIAALFLYFVSVKYNWSSPFFNQGIFRFFLFAIIISCFYSVKMLMLKSLSYILEIDKPVAVYIFNIFLINNILGMALIPVVAALAYVTFEYSSYVLYTGVAIVLLSFGYRMFRAYSITSALSRFSLYYLFIYFCALEIAPVLVLVKLASR